MSKQIFLENEKATLNFGATLAKLSPKNFTFYLYGELGAGKTTLVRGFLKSLGHKKTVKSPTYTLVESYSLQNKTIHHFDLYRLIDPEELELIGIRDYFSEDAIRLVEWPEKAEDCLPTPDISCYINIENKSRKITLKTHTESGNEVLIGI